MYTMGHVLTVVKVDRLFHDAGLGRGNPQRKARLFQAEAEQVLRPVSHLAAFSARPRQVKETMSVILTRERLPPGIGA